MCQSILIVFDRKYLRASASGAKFDVEVDFEVRLPPAPPKPHENCENRNFQSKFFIEKIFSVSKNETLGIVRNAFSQSFVAVRAMFEG